ncbi:MAG: type II secretion system inner membrane protein GspF [Immundisolibacter sp.]|uniref:type II secretion system inner membrane protein GspF n=1 Tax=Immundisolibacter sp. TaxID=1934948 RepID=UPI003EE0CE40
MAAFQYTAARADGANTRGLIEADSARLARAELRRQGLLPLDLAEVRASRAGAGFSLRREHLNGPELTLLTRQLAVMVDSGLPLEETLRSVAEQADAPRLKRVLTAVRSRVLEGHSLNAALAEHPHSFAEYYRAAVSAGEAAGRMGPVMDRLADFMEQRQVLQQKVTLALFYPATLTVVSIAVVIGLLTYVVPEIVQVFDRMGQALPWITRALIWVSDFLRAWGLALLALLAVVGVGARLMLRVPALRLRYAAGVLRLPLFGRLLRGLDEARFTSTLGTLVGAGVNLVDGLRVAARVVGNPHLRAGFEAAAERVREGSTLHQALRRQHLLPAMSQRLIASGEAGGELAAMLERAATLQERALQNTVAVLMGVFEPALILSMGGAVLVIVLAILMPIFELNQLVQ